MIAGIALLEGVVEVAAEPTEKPVRSRFNSNVLVDLFHKGDQRMLLAFSDLKVDDIPVEGHDAPDGNESENAESET